MEKKGRFWIIALLTFWQVYAWAQDPNYSQFYNNPIYYNVAMTGINDGTTIRNNVRNLWGPIPGRFNTVTASVDAQSIYKMGFGLNFYSDIAGEAYLRTLGGYLAYSYRLVDTRNFIIQTGVAGGFVSKSIDWSKLVFSNQVDETRGVVYPSSFQSPGYNKVSYADLNTGLVLRFNGNRKTRRAFKKYMVTLGGSIHHLSQPNDDFLGSEKTVPIRVIYHGDIQMLFWDVVLRPGLVMEHQNEFRTFSAGVNFTQKPFTFGLWFRNRTIALSANQYDSFIITAGARLPNWGSVVPKFQYNYDITVSRLKTSSYGTHEFSLVLELPDRVIFGKAARERAARRIFSCPSDFMD